MRDRRWGGLRDADGDVRLAAPRLVLFLLTAAVIARAALAAAEPARDLLALLSLAAFAWTVRPRPSEESAPREWGLRAAAFAALFLAAAVAIRLLAGPAQLLVFALFLSGVDLSAPSKGEGRGDLRAMQLTLLLYAVFLLLADRVPYVDAALRSAAAALSWEAAAFVPAGGISVGPGYLGLHLISLFLLHALSVTVFARARSGFKLAAVSAAVLACGLGYAVAWGWASGNAAVVRYAAVFEPLAAAHDYRLLLFALLLVPAVAYRLSSPPGPASAVSTRRETLLAAALAAALGVSSFLLVARPPSTAFERRVVILDAVGNMDTDLPTFSAFGLTRAGQFGMLPSYLRDSGYEVRVVRKVTREVLERTGTLVLINLRKDFDESESRAIWEFVDAGGSLLVLGEHTGREEIRDPTNRLLEPVGISLEFDSAMPVPQGWRNGFDQRTHPIGEGIGEGEVQIQVGASLKVDPPARPVLVGRAGFSDPGDVKNPKNGYLGDMRFGRGEHMGDVILAAEATHGDGKVLVFGDTTFVQNPVIAYSYRFVDNVFGWMAGRNEATTWRLVATVSGAALAILAALAALAAGRSAWGVALPAAAVALALVVASALARPAAHDWDAREPARPRAVVDASHLELGRLDASPDGLNGLVLNLVRNGYSPLVMRGFSPEMLGASELLVLPAPMRPFTAKETGAIDAFVARGGLLVVTVAADEAAGARPLLQHLGFELRSVPLGRQISESKRWNVGLWGGWPLRDTRGGAEVIAKVWDYPVAMYRRQARGGVLVVGDSAFLMNKNLEDRDSSNPNNIQFLRAFLAEYGKGGESDP